jgi:hypothetical protein
MMVMKSFSFQRWAAGEEKRALANRITDIDGVGGSTIGGGKGGAFLICTGENVDLVNRMILSDTSLVVVPRECLGNSLGPRILLKS